MFTKVGTYIVSSAEDDTVKVWDLKYMKAPTTIIRQRMGVNRSVLLHCIVPRDPFLVPETDGSGAGLAHTDWPCRRWWPRWRRLATMATLCCTI